MNSLIARVHVDMGKYSENPTLAIYENTDVHALLTDFINEWELPIMIYNKIYEKISQELENHHYRLINQESSFSTGAKGRKSPQSYINSSIQQQKTVIKATKMTNLSDIYTPIQRLKPQFKQIQPQTKPAQMNLPTENHPTKFIHLRPSTQKKLKNNLITFKAIIQRKIRQIFLKLKGHNYKNHLFLIPELISCSLDGEEFDVLNQFLECLEEEDFYSLDQDKFTQLVFQKEFAGKFYQKFR